MEWGCEHNWAVLNGKRMPVAEARVPVVDEGFLRGDGVFEVLRLYQGRPFRGREHLDRLARSAEILRLPHDRQALEREVHELALIAGRRDCAMRIVVSRGGTRLVMLEALQPLEPVGRLVLIVDQPRPVLRGAKTLSYAANMLAAAAAREAGGTDALFVTGDGRVLESQTAAFFWVDREGQLATPPVSEGILDSITRRIVLSEMPAIERPCLVSDALQCREAFLASTLREVQPVAAIGEVTLSPIPGPLTEEAARRFREVVRSETGVTDVRRAGESS
jgi:branched-chain amino acid aminotransferase